MFASLMISEDEKMKERLKRIIQGENKKNPYTDFQLSEILQLSREAITNLRNEMNIPNSRERRKNNLLGLVENILNKDSNISERDLTKIVNERGFNISRYTIRECKKAIKEDKKNSTKNINKTYKKGISENENDVIYQSFKNIIGSTGSLKPHIQLAQAAMLYPPRGLHTLILGETGVGKSELAAAMYEFAKDIKVIDEDRPFVIFNCADYADNPQLLMSQLFGYVKGAFTGAEEDKEGLVEKAEKSILFLDEVHRLPAEGQELLFYLIDKGKFRRLGETDNEREVQLTIIAATTENPDSALLATFKRRIPMVIELPSLKERPFDERLELIKEFFRKEANRTQSSLIKVSKEALNALLLYDCPGNIGQLRSDIQVSCARSFLDYVVKRKDVMEITADELPLSAKKGLLTIRKSRLKNMNLIKGSSILIHSDNEPVQMSPYENLYILPNEIYGYIESRYNELNHQNMNQEAINHIIGAEMEEKLEILMNRVKRNTRPLSRMDLAKVVGDDIIEIVENIVQIADIKLGINPDNLFYVLAIHLATTIDRVKQGKKIKNPQLSKIKRDYKEEFQIAWEMVKTIEKNFNVKLSEDEAGFITMYLRMTREEENRTEGRVGVVVISHGNIANGMADVANKLLGVNHAKAVEMSLDESPEPVLERATEVVKECDEGKGVLLLVDMGSLVTFGEIITKNTEIRTRSISRTDVVMVIEAVRRSILPNADLDEIADTLIEEPKYTGRLFQTNKKSDSKSKTIITICITGHGSAQKIKELIENLAQRYDEDINIISIGAMNEDIDDTIRSIQKTREVVAIIGTVDPKFGGIPYIPLEDVIMGNIESRLKEVLDRNIENIEIKNIMSPQNILINMKTKSKKETVIKLVDLLYKDNKVNENFLNSVLAREEIGPTFLNEKVVIPHGDSVNVIKPSISIGILKDEIEWDGKKVKIVVLLGFDENCIDMVREISEFFKDENNYNKLIEARNVDEVMQLFGR